MKVQLARVDTLARLNLIRSLALTESTGYNLYMAMGMHGGGGWFGYLRATDEKPKMTWTLLKRVLRYARPYRWHIAGMLVLILITTGTSLLMPLIFRRMIDYTIPAGDIPQLVLLSLALLVIPALNGIINVFQRQLNARVGEGVVYDLRVDLFARLQRMSLRFFTNTKVGELMSRLNNDVVGAQNAISNTIVNIVTNLIQATAVLLVMLTLEWHLTIISVLILPLFILAARHLGTRLRDISRQQMDANAAMNAMMVETLNISGALLVKLFGRRDVETDRCAARAAPEKHPRPIGGQIDPSCVQIDDGRLRERIAHLNRGACIANLRHGIACPAHGSRSFEQSSAAAHAETRREGIGMQERPAQLTADCRFIGVNI